MSRSKRCVTVLCCLAMLTTWAYGQATTAPAPAASSADLLKNVPAGCMGFVVVGSLNGASGKVQAFLKDTGLASMLPLPGGGDLVNLLKQGVRIGEGFDPDGGLAIVMLDPQQYGIDVVGLISGKAPETKTPPPIVILLPGKDPEKMFAAGNPTKEGGVVKFTGVDGDPAYATQAGKHVLVSDNLDALKAAAASKKSMAEQLSAQDKAFIARNDAAVWVDMKMTAPILDAAITKMNEEAKGGSVNPLMAMQAGFAEMLTGVQQTLKQMSSVMLGGRLDKVGIILEVQAGFAADSAYGKALAAFSGRTPRLNRLPTMPYIFAMTGQSRVKLAKPDLEKELDASLAREPFKGLSPENKAKARALMLGLNEQVQGIQLYIGGLVGGSGQVGAAIVMDCQSADKVKEMLADLVALLPDILQAAVKDADLKGLQIKYVKALENVGDKKADAISIEHPELTGMSEENRKKMSAVLGEDKVRLLLGAPDEKTLVITFGGGKTFLAEAMKTAQAGSGALDKDPGIVKANSVLPKDRVLSGYLNIGNVIGVFKNVSAAVGEPPPPIEMVAATPFSFAVSISGTNVSIVGLLPTDTIAEIIKAFVGMMGGGMGGAPPGVIEGGGGDQ